MYSFSHVITYVTGLRQGLLRTKMIITSQLVIGGIDDPGFLINSSLIIVKIDRGLFDLM